MWIRLLESLQYLFGLMKPPRVLPGASPLETKRERAAKALQARGFILEGAIPFRYFVVHHSKSKDGQVHDWPSIKNYHMSWRYEGNIITEEKAKALLSQGVKGVQSKWSDIGYHAGEELINGVYQLQIGRPLTAAGAHAIGFNLNGFGFLCAGDFDLTPPSDTLWQLSVELAADAINYWTDLSVENVIGHWETYDMRHVPREKSCPGFKFDMPKLRKDIKGII